MTDPTPYAATSGDVRAARERESAQRSAGATAHSANMRSPERGIAALRIVVGLWFVKSMVTKLGVALLFGLLPLPAANARWTATMPKLIARYASDNPIAPYKAFLLDTVIPNAHLFATLTALGETVVGLGLTLGLFTLPVSVVGMMLVTTYGLATFWMGPSQQGFHVLLFACLVVFIVTRAGRRWGLDGWLRETRPWWRRDYLN